MTKSYRQSSIYFIVFLSMTAWGIDLINGQIEELEEQEKRIVSLDALDDNDPGAAIPSNKKQLSDRKFNQAYRRFRERLALDRYKKLTKDSQQARQSVTTFLKLYAKSLSGSSSQLKKVAAQYEKAIKAGTKDLLARTYYMYAIRAPKTQYFFTESEKLLSLMENDEAYAFEVYMLCYWNLAKMGRKVSDAETEARKKRYQLLMIRNMIRLCEKKRFKAFGGQTQRYLLKVLDYGFARKGEEHESFLVSIKDQEQLDPWLKDMLLGKTYLAMYYKQRPEMSVHYPSKAALTYLAKAKEHFASAWEIKPGFPEAPALLINVIRWQAELQEVESPRIWFDRAVKGQFDFDEAYENYIRYHLNATGDFASLIHFGMACKATERYDSRVPMRLISILRAVDRKLEHQDVWQVEGVYEAVKDLCLRQAEHNRQIHMKRFYYSIIGVLAFHTKHYDDAKSYIEKTEGKPANQAFWELGVGDASIFKRALTIATPNKNVTELVERALAMNKSHELHQGTWLKTLRDRAAKLPDNAQERARIQALIKRFEFADEFRKGGWVNLPLDKKLSCWRFMDELWKADAKSVVLKADGEKRSSLYFEQPFAGPYSVEVSIELLKEDSNQRHEAGISIGHRNLLGPDMSTKHSGKAWYIDPVKGVLSFEQGLSRIERSFVPSKVNRLRIDAWDNCFAIYINEQHLGTFTDLYFKPDGPLRFQNVSRLAQYHHVRFSRMRVRQLKGKPPHIYQEDYRAFDQVLANSPDKPAIQLMRARAYMDRLPEPGKYLPLFEKAALNTPKQFVYKFVLAQYQVETGKHRQAYTLLNQLYVSLNQSRVTDSEHKKLRQKVERLMSLLESSSQFESVRKGAEAVSRMLAMARANHERLPHDLELLAAAYAESDDYDKALLWQRKAIRLYGRLNAPTLLAAANARVALYLQGRPFRLLESESMVEAFPESIADLPKEIKPDAAVALFALAKVNVDDQLIHRWGFDGMAREMHRQKKSLLPFNTRRLYERGMVGYALLFDQHLSLKSESTQRFRLDDAFTLSLWVNPSLDTGVLMGNSINALNINRFSGFLLALDKGRPKLTIGLIRGSPYVSSLARSQIPLHQWTHLLVTYDGSGKSSGFKWFVNAESVPDDFEGAFYPYKKRRSVVKSSTLYIGHVTGHQPYSGSMDEVRIYGKALTAEQVIHVMNYPEVVSVN